MLRRGEGVCARLQRGMGRMYESHFGLKQRPFRSAPDGSRYYPATGHEDALEQLLQALADDEGLVLLTGALLVPALSLPHALLAILIGTALGCIPLALVGLAGAREGVPGMVLFRPVLGRRLNAELRQADPLSDRLHHPRST